MKEKVYRISIDDKNLYDKFLENNEIFIKSDEKPLNKENLKNTLAKKGLSKRSQVSLLNLLEKLEQRDLVWLKNKNNFAIGTVIDPIKELEDKISLDIKFYRYDDGKDITSIFRGSRFANIKNEDNINLSKEIFRKLSTVNKEEKILKTKNEELMKHQNSGKISFTEISDNSNEKSLALNTERYLIPKSNVTVDFTKKKTEESIKIDYTDKDKDNSLDKSFEIILEVSPNAEAEDKGTRKHKENKKNLPMIIDSREVEKEVSSIYDIYKEAVVKQVKLNCEMTNTFIKTGVEIQKMFFDNYFKFLENIIKK